MLEIKSLDDVRGNNVVIYAMKMLLSKSTFPRFSILSGHMGVGKSTVARLIAKELNKSEYDIKVFNLGLEVDMNMLEETVFSMNPIKPRAFLFEELHGLNKSQQTALLAMLDKQPNNVYILATTTEIYKILNTIRSRATVWDFKLLSERQLRQLLDDYLMYLDKDLTVSSKKVLLKSCYGVPRDLIKNVDLAISGDFTTEQLNELLGHVSEDLVFSILCSLKSDTLDFSVNMTKLIEESSRDKLFQLRDFYVRFLLEKGGIEGGTISKDKISVLTSLFNNNELEKIGKVLVRSSPETLMLELSLLNMNFTGTTRVNMIGQQMNRVAQNLPKAYAQASDMDVKDRLNNAKITASSIKNLRLDE